MTDQQSNPTEITKLPANVELYWGARFGSETNQEIAKTYGFNIGKIAGLTILINEIFFKRIAISEIDKEIVKNRLATGEAVAQFTVEILGKKFLIVDDEWFGGEVKKKIKELGGNPDNFAAYIKQYKDKVAEELQQAEEVKKREEAEDLSQRRMVKKEQLAASQAEVMKDPADEMRSAKIVFTQYIVPVLQADDYRSRIELNSRLIALFAQDEPTKQFQNELLKLMYENNEIITKEKIVLKNEPADPTVGNWLKDYVYYVGIDEVASNIKKTQYFINSKNIRQLSPEERRMIDRLFDTYLAIKNFYENIRKLALEDIYIFPFTEKEVEEFIADMEAEQAEEEAESAGLDALEGEEIKTLNIEALLAGKPDEKMAIEGEKTKITKETRNEKDKLADLLEENLLRRRKINTIACLENLADTGSLDDIIADDPRFQDLLIRYFKRNNLSGEEANFHKSPRDAKYVEHFLKFVYLERLGMNTFEGARYAARISNISRDKGLNEYAQMAYFDLSDNKFKWS